MAQLHAVGGGSHRFYGVGHVHAQPAPQVIGISFPSSPTGSALATSARQSHTQIITLADNNSAAQIHFPRPGSDFRQVFARGIQFHFSDLTEQILISNLSGGALDMHFFQYSDFDLNGTPSNDSLTFSGTPVNLLSQSDPTGPAIFETVVVRAANEHRGDYVDVIRESLNYGGQTTLDNTNHVTAPGDAAWAFQWDQSIPVNGDFGISKDKFLAIREHSSLLLISLGLACFVIRRSRQTLSQCLLTLQPISGPEIADPCHGSSCD